MQGLEIVITEPCEKLYDKGLKFAYDIFLSKHDTKVVNLPNLLAIAQHQGEIVGTMGLIYGKDKLYFFEQCDPGNAFTRLSGNAPRTLLAEITRFAINEELADTPSISKCVAEKLLRQLLEQGKKRNLIYYGFVGKTSFRILLTPLGISPIKLGVPTLSHIPKEVIGTYAQQRNLFSFGFKLN